MNNGGTQIGEAIFLEKNGGAQIGGAIFLERNGGTQIGGAIFPEKSGGTQIGGAIFLEKDVTERTFPREIRPPISDPAFFSRNARPGGPGRAPPHNLPKIATFT